MNTPQDSTGSKRQPPVARYAAIIGILIVIGIIASVIAGQKGENPRPAGVLSSPRPGASIGPSPRY